MKWFRSRKDNQRGDRRQRFVTFRLRGAERRGGDEEVMRSYRGSAGPAGT